MSVSSRCCASTNAVHQMILIEADVLQQIATKPSVRFWKNVSGAMSQISHQLQAMPKRFLDHKANSDNVECQYSAAYLLSLSSLKIRAQCLQNHAELLQQSSEEHDLWFSDIFMGISKRLSIFFNGLTEDVPKNEREVLTIILAEITGRLKYMQNKILFYNKIENGNLVVFVLDKLCRSAIRQHAILKSAIMCSTKDTIENEELLY
mmetsp:Transcript_757/g.981  ORF Transcript_757/g.981 Transcript_757/m.981 type:complete len:206 (-) Transcript_757:242-859(-)